MYLQIGTAAALANMGGILCMVPLQSAFSSRFGSLRKETVAWRDERIRSLSDLLNGISTIK